MKLIIIYFILCIDKFNSLSLSLCHYLNIKGFNQMSLESQQKTLFVTSDNYPFYLQLDGTLTDTPDKNDCSMTYEGLTQLFEADPDTRIGFAADRLHFKKALENSTW